MAGEELIGKGKVEVSADTSNFDKSMNALPKKGAAAMSATGAAMNSVWLDQQVIGKMNQTGAAGRKMGSEVRDGASNGAMGLMLMAQTIDDAAYGFRAIVNNIPQVSMAIGSAMGASSEAAMKFGGAMGIAAVAVNTWANNWEHAKAVFGGGGGMFDDILREMNRLEDGARSLFATLLNLGNGWDWVSTTGDEAAAVAKQVEDKAAFAERRAQQVVANRASVGGMRADADEKRSKAFSDAVGEYGGGDKLAENLFRQRMAKLAPDASEFDPFGQQTRAEFNKAKEQRRITREKQIREQVDNDILNARAGSPEAIKALMGEDPALKRAVAANAPGAKEARDKAKRDRDSAISKTAGSLQDTVGRELLSDPDMGVSELWGKIKEAMEQAGYSTKEIVDTLPGISVKIREDMEAKVRERADREGISEDAARKGMLADAAERDKRKAEGTPEYREAQRLAGAMDGKALLRDGGMSDADLEKGVRKNLKSAGLDDSKIEASAAQVAKLLREKVEAQVQERALGQGISEGEARAQMLKERMDQENQNAPKAEVMSTESYLNKALVTSLDQRNDIPNKQLTEQQTTNKKLDSVIKELAKPKKGTFATFAPGR